MVLAWDLDFTKVTPEEAKRIEETGNANPSLRTLVRLAEEIGVQLRVEVCSASG